MPHFLPRPLQFIVVLVLILALSPLIATEGMASSSSVMAGIAALRARKVWSPLDAHPVQVDGIVTFFDPARNLVVIQDKEAALGFDLGHVRRDFHVGHRVVLHAEDSWPLVPNLARFPDRPDSREVLPQFEWEFPTEGGFFVSRYRALLRPPETGAYRFFISSDDSSMLLLSPDGSPRARSLIARVSSYTRPHDWTRTPSQRSAEIQLEKGRAYYIEVVHHQASGPSHLAVAWEGPGITLRNIDAECLQAWQPDLPNVGDGAGAGSPGVLRETWNDVPVSTPEEMLAPRRLESVLSVRGISITEQGPGKLPEPAQLKIGQKLPLDANFLWAELEGTVDFVGISGRQVRLELSDGGRTLEVLADSWPQSSPAALRGRRIRVVGVVESVWTHDSPQVAGRLWLQPSTGVVLTDHAPQAEVARLSNISELLQQQSGEVGDTAVKFRGRVVSQAGNTLTLSDDGVFHGFVSHDGLSWTPVGTALDNEMPSRVHIGFAVNSRLPMARSRAVFSKVQGLPSTPRLTDIGSPACAGGLTVADGNYVIDGVGTDMWDSPDQFTFVSESVDGDCSFVARLDAFVPGDPSAKAGLMIRERLSPDGQFISLVCTGEGGLQTPSLQWRWGREGSSTRLANYHSPTKASPLWLKLERRYSRIEVQANAPVLFEPGELVDVVGYSSRQQAKALVIRAAVHRSPREAGSVFDPGNWRPLVDLSQINDGTGRWAGYDIFRLRGVVTFCGDVLGRHYWTFQDRSAAALLVPRDSSPLFSVPAGHMVEVFGNPGWHPPSPSLHADNVFVLGPASMPTPIRHPAEYLLPRRGEGTWVELDGIVRSVPAPGVLQVKSRGELFSVAIPPRQAEQLEGLVDAEVRVRGAIVFPSEAERVLLVPDRSFLEVLSPAPADAFEGAVEEIQSFSGEGLVSQSRHRVRIVGTVTYAEQGLVYLQDQAGGARLELEPPAAAVVGATVIASGFPDWGADNCLVLRHALVRPHSHAPGIAPAVLPLEQVLGNSHLQRLVRLTAKVSSNWSGTEGGPLELAQGGHVFNVEFPRGQVPSVTLPAGSVVELTGVNTRELSPAARTAPSMPPLRILPRGTADLVVLQKPSMWVLRRTLIVASVVALAALVLVIWIQLLRKRVRQRTEELSCTMEKLKAEAAKSATLAERDRLAGEIHDSLEQGLNGIIFHLQCTSNMDSCSEDVREALSLACNMAAFSRTEVQYAVWELQSPMLEDSDLLTAIEKISRQIAPESLCATVKVQGAVRRLSSSLEHHLLRVVQEALNNVVKHAKASQAEVLLRYGEQGVELSISDNGCGFNPPEVRIGGLGHFGLRSLRSRVTRIHGTLDVSSQPGKGTTLRVRVPLSQP